MDVLTVGASAEDALNLIDTVDELLAPLTQTGSEPDPSELYDLSHRAKMIDSTLRAAREKVEEIVKLID